MKRNILGQRKDYWGPLEALENVAPESAEIVRSVQHLPNIRYVLFTGSLLAYTSFSLFLQVRFEVI